MHRRREGHPQGKDDVEGRLGLLDGDLYRRVVDGPDADRVLQRLVEAGLVAIVVVAAHYVTHQVLVLTRVVRVAGAQDPHHEVLGEQVITVGPQQALLELDCVDLAVV